MCLLLKFFNYNYRRLFNAIKDTFLYYIYNLSDEYWNYLFDNFNYDNNKSYRKQLLESKKYLIIEGLLLAGHYYNLNPYKYEQENEIITRNRSNISNRSYILNIYSFPILNNKQNKMIFFCGLRILQYMKFNNYICSTKEISQFLSKYFWYPSEIVEIKTEEILESGLISVYDPIINSDPNKIILNKCGEYLLDKMCLDIEYNYLSCQSAPLLSELLDNNRFVIKRISDENYVFNKIQTCIEFVSTSNKC